VEIERKFIVLGQFTESDEIIQIRQAYVLKKDGVEIRIRHRSDSGCLITVKVGKGLAREEWEMPIPESIFKHLWEASKENSIEKERHLIPYHYKDVNGEKHSVTIKVDVFTDPSFGMLAEIEFETEEEALSFYPPDWFGKEVTENFRYRNASLTELGWPRE